VIAGLIGFSSPGGLYSQPKTPKKLAARSLRLQTAQRKILRGRIVRRRNCPALVWISDKVLWHVVDESLIDGTVNNIARASRETGDRLRHASTGNIRTYAAWILVGAVVFTSLLLWMAG